MRIGLTGLGLAAVLMAGCSSLNVATVSTPQSAASISGVVMGGQQPIVGASVQLYSIDPTQGQNALLATPIVTGMGGSFSLDIPGTTTPLFTCPTQTTPTFLVVSGGNPGLMPTTINNKAISLADALGDCGTLTTTTKIVINEATTVAFAAQYYAMTSATTQTALEQAFTVMAELTNFRTGLSPGVGQTSTDSGGAVPSSKLYTLANVVAACVDTDGTLNSTTPCGKFFANVPYSGGQPTDTLTALISLQEQSQMAFYNNNLFALASPTGPFQPELAAAPSDWFITITQPTLNGILVANPAAGKAGSTTAITSTNYTTSNAVCPFTPPLTIVIGGQQSAGSFSATQITVTVPAGAVSGSGLGQVVTQYGTCTFPFTVQ